MFCPKCGKELEEKSVTCTGCEFDLSFLYEPEENAEVEGLGESQPEVLEPQEAPKAEPEETPEPQPEKTVDLKPSKNTYVIGAAALVLIVAAIFAGVSFFSKPSKQMPIVYFKDDTLLLKNNNMKKSIEITDDLTDNSDLANSEDFYDEFSNFVDVSDDGKKMFFVTKVDTDGDDGVVGQLYMRSTTDEKVNGTDETGTLLSDDVCYIPSLDQSFYTIVGGGTGVLYMTDFSFDDGGKLYFHDLKEAIEVDKDVMSARVSEDGKTVLYEKSSGDNESDLYTFELKKGAEPAKVVNNIPRNSIEAVSNDLKTIYYKESLNDEFNNVKLFVVKDGKAEKVTDEISGLMSGIDPETGKFFFSRHVKKDIKLSDILEDDLKAADAALVEPKETDYQKTEQAYDYWYGAYTQTVTDWDQYYAASQKYSEKMNRDSIREYAKTTVKELDTYDLYYYSEGKEEKIVENYSTVTYANEKYKIANYKKNKMADTKLKISTMTSSYDLDMAVSDINTGDEATQLYAKGESTEIASKENIQSVNVAGDGKSLIYILMQSNTSTDSESDYASEIEGDLMKVDLSSDKVGKSEKIAKNVSRYEIKEDGNTIYYYTKISNNTADLYKVVGTEDEKIASDVRVGFTTISEEDDCIYAIEEYNSEKNKGDFVIINGKDKEKVSEDVSDFVVYSSKQIFLMKDYKNGEGDLYEWTGKKGKEPVEVDTNVNQLVLFEGNYF